jgi:hypothetical protein
MEYMPTVLSVSARGPAHASAGGASRCVSDCHAAYQEPEAAESRAPREPHMRDLRAPLLLKARRLLKREDEWWQPHQGHCRAQPKQSAAFGGDAIRNPHKQTPPPLICAGQTFVESRLPDWQASIAAAPPSRPRYQTLRNPQTRLCVAKVSQRIPARATATDFESRSIMA